MWRGSKRAESPASLSLPAGHPIGDPQHLESCGSATTSGQFRPFPEALAYARSLRLPGKNAWNDWSRSGARPAYIPSNPNIVYGSIDTSQRQSWQGWGHWLGNDRTRSTQFRQFPEALAFARSLGLGSSTAWQKWSRSGARPSDIPSNPDQSYRGQGWQGFGHWLGTGRTAHSSQSRPFPEALAYAQSLRLPSKRAWHDWSKNGGRPADIPSNPAREYEREGWQGWGHWLGNESNK